MTSTNGSRAFRQTGTIGSTPYESELADRSLGATLG
jgi:hypothetical protein